jgi:hypothetical protein
MVSTLEYIILGLNTFKYNMGNWFKKAGKTIKKSADKVADKAKDTTNTVVKETTNAANTVAKETTNAANTVAKETTKVANTVAKTTTNIYTDSKKAVVKTTNVVAKNTEEAAKQGLDVASDTWKEGSSQAIEFAKDGLEAVEDAAESAVDWLDENACYIGLNMALTTGCVAYFTPKPAPADPGTVTSTTISATMLAAMASVGQKVAIMVVSKEVGKLLADGIFLIPGVKGKCDKELLTRVLTNVVGKANPIYATAALSTPAGVGLFVGSVVSPIVATLICEGVVPNGFSKLDD